MTVIASVKLDYVRAPGRRARQSEPREPGFRSRSNQSYLLYAFDRRRDKFRQLDLQPRRRTKAETKSRLLCYCFSYLLMCVPEDRWAIGTNVIEKCISICIDHCCTTATFDEDWCSADRLPRAHGGIHRTRNLNTSAVVEFI